jgi:multicomponent Na+:H+ antiporter subunit E
MSPFLNPTFKWRSRLEKDSEPIVRPSTADEKPSKTRRSKGLRINFLLSFLILFLLWIVFSGKFDAFHIALGLISSAIVAKISGDLLFTSTRPQGLFSLWLRLFAYIPWLIYQIFLANVHVMYLVFHPKMMDLINPKIIEFESRLKSDYGRTTFANSITLTPGTITVNVTVLGRFSVHCIDDPSGLALPGDMEERIVKVFRE